MVDAIGFVFTALLAIFVYRLLEPYIGLAALFVGGLLLYVARPLITGIVGEIAAGGLPQLFRALRNLPRDLRENWAKRVPPRRARRDARSTDRTPERGSWCWPPPA